MYMSGEKFKFVHAKICQQEIFFFIYIQPGPTTHLLMKKVFFSELGNVTFTFYLCTLFN